MTELYNFQKRGVEFHLTHHYSLNRCEMGLGKTLQALAVAEKVGGETLVFCPAFLSATWKGEIEKHLGQEFLSKFLIIPYSTLSSRTSGFGALYEKKFRTIIADECHYLKTETSNRTKKFFMLLDKLKPEYFIGLSGTPVKNRLQEFYTLLKAVSKNPKKTSGIDVLKYFPTQEKFCDRYCYRRELSFGGGRQVQWHGVRPSRIKELKELLDKKIFNVDAKDEVKLPPLIHKEVYAEIKEDIDGEMAAEYEKYVLGGKSSTAKKASALLKAKFTCSYVEEILAETETPVVIFTDHVDSCVAIANHFKVQPIHGGVSVEDRVKIASNFKVLVATIGSFSVGVTLTSAKNLVFNDISWIPADNFQAMKRIHRIGQNQTCVIHYVLGGRVDKFILNMIRQKMKVIEAVK